MNRSVIIAIIITILSMAYCRKGDPACYEPKSVNAVINYSNKILRQVDTIIDSIVVDTTIITFKDTSLPYLNALSLFVDSPILITASRGSSNIGLLLNPRELYTSYRIAYDTGIAVYDTLTIFHHATPAFISNNCGYTYFFTIDSIKYFSSIVDSFVMINKNITRESGVKNRMTNFYFFN